MLFLLSVSSGLAGYLGNRFVTPVVIHIVSRTKTVLDDYFFNRPVLKAFWHVVPGLLFYVLLPSCATEQTTSGTLTFVSGAASIYITATFIHLATSFLTNVGIFTAEHDRLKSHHLAGVIQFLKLIVYFIGSLVIVAFLLGRNPVGLVAGLGAAATVLMLVFKDTILGLVAGIQLSANHMMKVGDWVVIEKMGINGTVEQVSLTTVKIRNFDNTISTVPPYTLVSESFHNWEAMKERGARRVKRAVYMDVNSIRSYGETELAHLKADGLITAEEAATTGGIVNLTLFRHYAERFLHEHPRVLKDLPGQWIMARQLEATPEGLPVEFWFYLNETNFPRYEDLAATIIEHLIAVAPHFGLSIYQRPAGRDFHQTADLCSVR